MPTVHIPKDCIQVLEQHAFMLDVSNGPDIILATDGYVKIYWDARVGTVYFSKAHTFDRWSNSRDFYFSGNIYTPTGLKAALNHVHAALKPHHFWALYPQGIWPTNPDGPTCLHAALPGSESLALLQQAWHPVLVQDLPQRADAEPWAEWLVRDPRPYCLLESNGVVVVCHISYPNTDDTLGSLSIRRIVAPGHTSTELDVYGPLASDLPIPPKLTHPHLPRTYLPPTLACDILAQCFSAPNPDAIAAVFLQIAVQPLLEGYTGDLVVHVSHSSRMYAQGQSSVVIPASCNALAAVYSTVYAHLDGTWRCRKQLTYTLPTSAHARAELLLRAQAVGRCPI